jgi:hypothetical protein
MGRNCQLPRALSSLIARHLPSPGRVFEESTKGGAYFSNFRGGAVALARRMLSLVSDWVCWQGLFVNDRARGPKVTGVRRGPRGTAGQTEEAVVIAAPPGPSSARRSQLRVIPPHRAEAAPVFSPWQDDADGAWSPSGPRAGAGDLRAVGGHPVSPAGVVRACSSPATEPQDTYHRSASLASAGTRRGVPAAQATQATQPTKPRRRGKSA